MKKYFIHSPVFRILAPAIYGVLLYFLVLLINNNVSRINDVFSDEEVYFFIGLSYLSLESCRLVIVFLGRLGPKLRSSAQATILQFILTSFVSIALVVAAIKLYFNYHLGFSISSTQLMILVILFLVTAVLYNVLYLTSYYLQKENTLKLNAEKQQRQVLELEMLEFKNDINPDLLYESLESIIALMYKDVDQAEAYIDCLASTYRYVLSNRQQELVAISEEISAATNIVRLLNERYNGQLRLKTDIPENTSHAMLIPGSLPLVIESLVRNTIITRFEPFIISCYVEDDYLTIQTKLNEKLIMHEASEHAFTRLQKSYSLYSELPLIKVKAYQESYVKLPLITVHEEMITAQ